MKRQMAGRAVVQWGGQGVGACITRQQGNATTTTKKDEIAHGCWRRACSRSVGNI